MTESHSRKSASATVGALASGTQRFLRSQLWVWPLLAAALLAFVGLWVRARMEQAMESQIAASLTATLQANAEALRNWSASVKAQAELLAGDEMMHASLARLVLQPGSESPTAARLLTSPEVAALRERLGKIVQQRGFDDYALLNTNLVVLASGRDGVMGSAAPPAFAEYLQQCLAGHSVLTLPFPSIVTQADEKGEFRTGVPSMFVATPVRSVKGDLLAVLGLRIAPEKDFTRILKTAQVGRTGETYAFNRRGVILSQSRFDGELKRLGLLPGTPDATSILQLELRDPLVDLAKSRRTPKPWTELEFTDAVAEAVKGQSGVNAAGYRDYRGVPVVGAWTWLPDFNLGLATEMDVSEAFAPRSIIRMAFWFLFGLLTAGSGVIFVLMRFAGKWHARAHAAAVKLRLLGQYELQEKIGAGGFGTVYHGHHALMRRPVAVKVLDQDADEHTIARFEREVQLTCKLTHPNTIALYDYGRTPQGLFYYAMEFLDGIGLDKLIQQYGPQPEGRVIHILRQVCASLSEAHGQGLIHRDIKPANIFLTRRGGIPDFVKVLDFGIVKGRSQPEDLELTAANALLGSPLYMSPEAIQTPTKVDCRSDLYSMGVVGYQLLTGETVFQGLSFAEVLLQQIRAQPEAPSARLKRAISADLEGLILQCLAKKPGERPASAAALETALGQCSAVSSWTRETAEAWWNKHLAAQGSQTVVLPVNVGK